MNDWRGWPVEDAGRCPLTLAVVETVGGVGVNRRSSPVLELGNIVGGWPDQTLLMVWACEPATVPPGHWLLCQGVTGDATVGWAHGANLAPGRLAG